ncbi:MAG: CHRD domain-containing protein [Acidobacteria bacterium]|nr:CHRD domain-containing protein [Acidobacteriota bacterium]
MMKRLRLFGLLMAAAVLFGGVESAQNDEPEFAAELTGVAEVPGPGDLDGSGSVTIRLNKVNAEACFEIAVEGIDPATAAHIHEAPEDKAGPVVVTLMPSPEDEEGESECVSVNPLLIERMVMNPSNFYVNVHNEKFPDGAIRGQLSMVKDD